MCNEIGCHKLLPSQNLYKKICVESWPILGSGGIAIIQYITLALHLSLALKVSGCEERTTTLNNF
jgi:hypothetical protein